MPGRGVQWLRRLWVAWLRFEYRTLAVLLPVVCFELAEADTLLAHLSGYVGLLGVLPALLGRDAWRFAAQIGPSPAPAHVLGAEP